MNNRQRDSTNGSSKSVITDLASFCYSDSVNMQSQNHEFPQTMQTTQHFSAVMGGFPPPYEAVGYVFRGGSPQPLPPPSGDGQHCSEMSSSVANSYSCSNNRSYNNSWTEPLQFVLAMQEILAEIACYVLENNEQMNCSTLSDHDHQSIVSGKSLLPGRESEVKKKHLLALLQLVDDRYNQCMDEIHTVTSAFHAVTELDPNLHARFALSAISFMYKSLRDRISSHILAIGAEHLIQGEVEANEEKSKAFMEKQWALQQLSKREHLFWKPQRGLPEKSVSVLKAWMFQNFLHPYPKDSEKHLLALRSGLTRNQVSNWFINARVRLWKPMIEEMYAEMSRRKAGLTEEETTNGSYGNRIRFENTGFTMN